MMHPGGGSRCRSPPSMEGDEIQQGVVRICELEACILQMRELD